MDERKDKKREQPENGGGTEHEKDHPYNNSGRERGIRVRRKLFAESGRNRSFGRRRSERNQCRGFDRLSVLLLPAGCSDASCSDSVGSAAGLLFSASGIPARTAASAAEAPA